MSASMDNPESLHVLTIKYDIGRPADLGDFSRSLLALASEYENHAASTIDPPFGAAMRLQIKQVQSGSIIADLVPYASGMLGFLADSNTVLSFAESLRDLYTRLVGDGNSAESSPKTATLKNFGDIVEPIAKDSSSQLNINQVSGNVNITITSTEAKAAQNEIGRIIRDGAVPHVGLHVQVAMHWHQARNDVTSNVGDRAIIESISPSPVKVAFTTEYMKAQMISTDDNPFDFAYIVDVYVETVKDRPVLYKVDKIHDSFKMLTE